MAGVCPRITTYPPLGSVTVLEPNQSEVTFTTIIEWERDRSYPFSCNLLYSAANGTHPSSWQQISMLSTEDSPSRVYVPEQTCRHATFTVTLPVECLRVGKMEDGSVHGVFSVQYQHYPGSPLKEMNANGGVAQGDFIIPATTPPSIKNMIALEDGWTVDSIPSLSIGTLSWRITSLKALPKSQSGDTMLEEQVIGRVIDQLRFMTTTRVEPFWYGATHDGSYFHLSEHAVLVCFLTKSGSYLSLLSYNGSDDFYQVFTGGPEGKVALGGRNDSTSSAPLRFLASVSQDRQGSIAEVMSQARIFNEKTTKMQAFLEKAITSEGMSAGEDFFDNLGYCTWNGIGQALTKNKILSGLEKLTAKGLIFNTLLIDDNWQTLGPTKLDPSEPGWLGWDRFEANTEGFANGLAGLVKEVKKQYPHIQYVGVWHAVLGYWAGLAHDGELARTYKTRMMRCKVRLSVETEVLVVDQDDVHKMYDDFYAFLHRSGVDFVKTDVQHLLSMIVDPKDREEIPSAYQSAWTSAYLRHFNGRAIGCMSQIPQISFHSLLQDKTPKILVRNNDDFFPEIPGSHTLHIFTNAHNALFTQHLNTLPDWDMFQTSHEYSSYHGAARAISGGPVLITDTPGEHDLNLINQMTATTPDRKQIALRPAVATAMDYFERYADSHILKIGTSTATSAGIIGCFNIGEGEREALIPYLDFERAAKVKGRFVARSFRSGQIFTFDTPLSKLVKVRLSPRSWDILTASPLMDIGSGVSAAVLGLLDKMSGAAGVTKVEILDHTINVELKALGKLGIFVGDIVNHVSKILVNGQCVAGNYISVSSGKKSSVVTIDLAAWWADSNRWNYEKSLRVEIRFGQHS